MLVLLSSFLLHLLNRHQSLRGGRCGAQRELLLHLLHGQQSLSGGRCGAQCELLLHLLHRHQSLRGGRHGAQRDVLHLFRARAANPRHGRCRWRCAGCRARGGTRSYARGGESRCARHFDRGRRSLHDDMLDYDMLDSRGITNEHGTGHGGGGGGKIGGDKECIVWNRNDRLLDSLHMVGLEHAYAHKFNHVCHRIGGGGRRIYPSPVLFANCIFGLVV